MEAKQSAYAAAGVDIDKKMGGIETIKQMVKKTVTPGVIGGIGSFGGLFQSPGADTILVASTDGVGTKLKVAAMAGRHDTVGQDIVNHCVNDILVQGATPLFFPRSSTATSSTRWSPASARRARRTVAPCSAARRPRCRASTLSASTTWWAPSWAR